MTRTERSFNPRAIIRDRSESKSGLDKSDRKGGAGAHNWGSYADEREHESLAVEDYEEETGLNPDGDVMEELASESSNAVSNGGTPASGRRPSTLSEQEIRQAREFRAKALKEGSADLVAIARTSAAVSTSPTDKVSNITITNDAQTSDSI